MALSIPGTVHALLPPETTARRAPPRGDLVATDAAALRSPLRAHVATSMERPLRDGAWQRFAVRGGRWYASWDRATKVPSRIWGSGTLAPGSVVSPEVAAAWARTTLAAHLDLLAPGASVDDFALVSNTMVGDQRVVGFAQRHQGLAVVGGQVSFRFKNDRLFVIGSEALPDVRVAMPRARRDGASLATAARDQAIRELALTGASATAGADVVILPLVGDDAVLGYRAVVPVDVDAGADGRWIAYVEPGSGTTLARAERTRFASGTLMYYAADRHAGGTYSPHPARRARVSVGGSPQTTAADGTLTWTGDAAVPLATTAVGDLVEIVNKAGRAATAPLQLAAGGTVTWKQPDQELVDAQINAYVHTMIANDFVREHIATLPLLDRLLTVNVNLPDQCNAYYDGSTLNFFQESSRCANTARIADVVYHEFGHAVHDAAVVTGVGRVDGAMGEGMADFLAAMITGDHGMARGFFFDEEPLRDIDPADKENVWPRDISEIHQTGLIFAGAMWDLRKQLIAELGEPAGSALVAKLYFAAISNSSNIPSSLIEVLAGDDDNGDLEDGTPHECAIKAAFGRHGLRTIFGAISAPGAISGSEVTNTPVELRLGGLSETCADDQIQRIDLSWRVREDSASTTGSTVMANEESIWRAVMPPPPSGEVLQYQIIVSFVGGAVQVFPDNRADPWYELYRGEVAELYCTDFETDPFEDGWTHGGEPAEADVWEWGIPGGGVAGDPSIAFSGDGMVGTNLDGGDGSYAVDGEARTMWMTLPPIATGQWSDVHLQYWRWLTVEDGYFDQASVTVDDQVAWTNFNSKMGDSSTAHHQDQQWVFHDVPVSPHLRDREATIRFALAADRGLSFGGWNIDKLCVVANVRSVCGDGVVTGAEECDNSTANAESSDACRTTCRLPVCGDAIVDSAEECDDGNTDDKDTCTKTCVYPSDLDDGCECSGRRGSPATLVPLALALMFALRRRRARA